MEANEFRIGNWVEGVDGICQITEILKRGINVINPDDIPPHPYDWIEPIPLIEEWLLKLGFMQSNNMKKFYNGNFDWMIFVNDNEFAFYRHDEMNGDVIYLTTIEYVHQLQNLYFALTGEELEMNEPS